MQSSAGVIRQLLLTPPTPAAAPTAVCPPPHRQRPPPAHQLVSVLCMQPEQLLGQVRQQDGTDGLEPRA